MAIHRKCFSFFCSFFSMGFVWKQGTNYSKTPCFSCYFPVKPVKKSGRSKSQPLSKKPEGFLYQDAIKLAKSPWWLIPRIASGWTNPGDFNGISGGKSSTYNWGELTHLLSGMSHQVRLTPKRKNMFDQRRSLDDAISCSVTKIQVLYHIPGYILGV